MEKVIFEYESYKFYINDWLDDPKRGGGYGSRSKMSLAIGCQTSYVAQVLKGQAHFSLEQIESINDFMGHSEQEGLFLLTIMQHERAGSPNLKARFKRQLAEINESRLVLKNRLGIKQPLTLQNQTMYYSSWYYAAIHVMASQQRFHSSKAISDHLLLDTSLVNSALQFLIEAGLIERKGGGFKVGKTTIHLGSESPLISKQHINWRLQAIRSLEKGKKQDLHYSSINTLSKKDISKIRELITKTIGQAQAIVKESPEEDVQCFSVDFFGV
jgi:uncharacterized protein (TIGR02147 family)